MRRKDCAIENTEQILHIVEAYDVIRLGLVDEGGTAYIVPVNFGIAAQEGKCRFYFHSALEGKKLTLMQAGPQISFEMDTAHSLQTSENVAKHTYHYACVMGHGTVRFVEDPAERLAGLQHLMDHYSEKRDWEFPEALLQRIHVLCLDVSDWTAKKH